MSEENTLMIDLMTVFSAHAEELDERERTIAVIKFMRLALIKSGHENSRIFASGYLNEALLAAETHMIVNVRAQGTDAVDKDGNPYEYKLTSAKLGKKANVNIHGPEVKSGENKAAYYERLRKSFLSKGVFLVKHIYDVDGHTGEAKANIYSFSPEFISMYMEHVNSWKKPNVNIGGTACTKIHRLMVYKKHEEAYLADPDKFDKTVFDKKINSSTECDAL